MKSFVAVLKYLDKAKLSLSCIPISARESVQIDTDEPGTVLYQEHLSTSTNSFLTPNMTCCITT